MRSEIMDGILRHIHPSGGIENAKLLEVSPGHAKLSVEITQKALNLYGNVHGGFYSPSATRRQECLLTPTRPPMSRNAAASIS